MTCGCQTACGCNLVNEDGTITIARQGDTFILAAIQFIDSVEDGTCIDLSVDGSHTLRASVMINDDPDDVGTVELECTDNGLIANLRIDPASTLPIVPTASGLRFDCCPTPPGDGAVPTGIIEDFAGVMVPPGWLETFGQEYPVTSFPDLFDTLTLYSTTGNVTSGLNTISGIPSTRGIMVGDPVDATGFLVRRYVASIDSDNQITVSGNADFTFTGDAEVRVHVWGEALTDPSYFKIPDTRDCVLAGMGNMGGIDRDLDGMTSVTLGQSLVMGGFWGEADVVLAANQIAAHSHTASTTSDYNNSQSTTQVNLGGATDISPVGPALATGVTIAEDGGHVHRAGPYDPDGIHPSSPERSFVMVDTDTIENHAVDLTGAATGGASPAVTEPHTHPQSGGTNYSIVVGQNDAHTAGILQQLNNPFTASNGVHDHPGSSASSTIFLPDVVSSTTVDASTGGGQAHNNVQPTVFVRKIIKT